MSGHFHSQLVPPSGWPWVGCVSWSTAMAWWPLLFLAHLFLAASGLYTISAAAKSFQSSPTLCDPIDSSPPGSTVPGILQARTLEWVAIFFSNAWRWKVKVKSLSRFQLWVTPWSAAYQAPPSLGFSRQEYWSGVPLPSPMQRLLMTKYRITWVCISHI